MEIRAQLSNIAAGLKSSQKKLFKEWSSLLTNWQFQLKLAGIASQIEVPKYQVKNNFHKKVDQTIAPLIKQIQEVVDGLKNGLSELPEDDDETLKKFAVQGVYKLNKNLLPTINELTDLKFVQQLMNSTSHLESLINEIVDQVMAKNKNSIDEKTNPNAGIWHSTLKPYVNSTLLPQLQKNITGHKHALSQNLEQLGQNAGDVHHILDFCFDNALEIIEKKKDDDTKEQDAWEILHSGFDNAVQKTNELRQILEDIHDGFIREMVKHVTIFANQVANLHFEQNINEIYLKLAKSRVVKKTQWFQETVGRAFVSMRKETRAFVRLHLLKLKVIINALRKKLHLSKPTPNITAELSNFLVEVNENIKNLPLVYKRLFELKPIDEINLFLGRKAELEQLNNAYKDWVTGNYAASVIVGENGSGKSSLANYFVSTLKTNYKTVTHSIDRFYSSENDFYQLISKLLETEINSQDECNAYIEKKQTKRIIIVDGLERLFLRKVNGNICLQMMLDFVVQTNDHIFWVFASAQHAWTYLDRIFRVSDYFDYTVKLANVQPDEVQGMIFKRNRLSGYEIVYDSTGVDVSKNFKKLTEKEQQAELERRYFQKLNQFAQSNVSLALSYWLVSIQKIKDNQLIIKNFKAP